MRVAVVGANGQLGTDVVRRFEGQGHEVCALTHQDIELRNKDSVCTVLGSLEPQVIVNTAAMHHVDACEQDPEAAFAVNAVGARNLALVNEALGSILMHVSTDYVFDGNRNTPYLEGDVPRPLNVYGITKLAGEHFIQCTTRKHFILRTSGLYGKHPCRAKGGLNFVELMLKLARERSELRVVDDEVLSPTPTEDLAAQIVMLSQSAAYGLYHATSGGSCSWYEFAREILKATNTPVILKVASPGEFPAKVARPKYSVLENRALKEQGLDLLKPWQDGLYRYLEATHRIERVAP